MLVVGTLKGYDQLMNLVLDDVKELLRGLLPVHCDYVGAVTDISFQMTKGMNLRAHWGSSSLAGPFSSSSPQ